MTYREGKVIRISAEAYDLLNAHREDDESWVEYVDRLLKGSSFGPIKTGAGTGSTGEA